MKFKTTSYHFDLIKDNERLSAFFQAINEYDGLCELAYDLGCGSGILSYFLSSKFSKIIAIEVENLASLKNINVVNEDVLEYEFDKKADLILCEMMDTALIDEEQVPVLNHAKKFLKPTGKIIPQGVINAAELVNMEREYIHWDENAKYDVYSDMVIYSEFDFLDDVDVCFEANLSFKAKKES